MAGAENSRRRQGGKGRPFGKGEHHGRPFKPGQSGNPGGRPASQVGFRERCREVAAALLERIADGSATDTDVRAFEAVADRGGFITADKWAVVSAALGKLLMGEGLTPEQRDRMVRDCREMLAIAAKPAGGAP